MQSDAERLEKAEAKVHRLADRLIVVSTALDGIWHELDANGRAKKIDVKTVRDRLVPVTAKDMRGSPESDEEEGED